MVVRVIGNQIECNGFVVAELRVDAPATLRDFFRHMVLRAADRLIVEAHEADDEE
jgi:hypothetical protein